MKPLQEWITELFDRAPPRHVLFRVDAGRVPGLSFGHLSRCLLLGKFIQEHYGCACLFLMRDYEEGIRYASQAGVEVETFPSNITFQFETEEILKAVGEHDSDWLLVDLPYRNLDTSYFISFQKRGGRVLFIDDFRFENPGADIYLNSSILAPARVQVPIDDRVRYCLGPQYFIFEPLVQTVIERNGCHDIFTVLLTFGGSDPIGLTQKIVSELLKSEWPDVEFQLILGPGFIEDSADKKLFQKWEERYAIVRQPSDILPYFLESDLVVCAGGRTMYELLHLKKKFIPIATTEIEAEAINEFRRQGLITHGLPSWEATSFIKTVKNFIPSS